MSEEKRKPYMPYVDPVGFRDLVYRPEGSVDTRHLPQEKGKGVYVTEGIAPNGREVFRFALAYRNRFQRPFAALISWIAKTVAKDTVNKAKNKSPFLPTYPPKDKTPYPI